MDRRAEPGLPLPVSGRCGIARPTADHAAATQLPLSCHSARPPLPRRAQWPDSTSIVLGRKAERGCGRPRCCASPIGTPLPRWRLRPDCLPARLTACAWAAPRRPPDRLRRPLSLRPKPEPVCPLLRLLPPSGRLPASHPNRGLHTDPLHAASKTKVDCPQPPARSPVPDGHLTHSGCFALPPAQRPARGGLPPPHPALIRPPPSHKAGRHPPCSLTPQGLPACRPDPHRHHPACLDLEAHPLHPTQRKDSPPPSAPNGRPPFPLRPPTWMQAQADTHPSSEAKGTTRFIVRGKGMDSAWAAQPEPSSGTSRTPPAGSRPRHRHRSGSTTPPQRTRRPPPPRTPVPAQAQTGLAEKAGASELEADRPAGEGVVVGA